MSKKNNWYLHFTYVDFHGIEHSIKYKMPREFKEAVCVVLGEVELKYEK